MALKKTIQIQLNVSFAREAHDWEVNIFTSLFRVLYSARVRQGNKNKLWWVPSKRILFKVRSFYCSLICSEGYCFPCKSIWRTRAPLKATFFTWSAALSKILTMNNFRKRQVIVVDRCYMCKGNGESVDHIPLHCDVAYVIWITFFSRFGLSGVMSRHVVDMFTCWTTSNTRSVATWKMVSTCLLWCLWREMNDKTFKDRERTLEEIKFFFIFG